MPKILRKYHGTEWSEISDAKALWLLETHDKENSLAELAAVKIGQILNVGLSIIRRAEADEESND